VASAMAEAEGARVLAATEAVTVWRRRGYSGGGGGGGEGGGGKSGGGEGGDSQGGGVEDGCVGVQLAQPGGGGDERRDVLNTQPVADQRVVAQRGASRQGVA